MLTLIFSCLAFIYVHILKEMEYRNSLFFGISLFCEYHSESLLTFFIVRANV